MSLLPRAFLVNDNYNLVLGTPVRPAPLITPPVPVQNDWTCATPQDNPSVAAVKKVAKAAPAPVTAKPAPAPLGPTFNPGDVVRILSGKGIYRYAGGWAEDLMGKWVGREVAVRRQHANTNAVYVDGSIYSFDARALELVTPSPASILAA